MDERGRAVVACDTPSMAFGWRAAGRAPFALMAGADDQLGPAS